MDRKTIRIYTRAHTYQEWDHYGDCTAAEAARELKNIKYLGLYYRMEMIPQMITAHLDRRGLGDHGQE